MSTFIVLVHVVVCISLIFVVLLQTGKGADMGAAFGGGSSQTLFGSTGASSFLSKMTTGAAIVFMLTSLSLAYFSGRRPTSSIMETVTPPPVTQEALPDNAPPMPVQSESMQPETDLPAPEAVTPPAAETTPTEGGGAPPQPVSDSSERG
jgi:preprotein translocase subunit SecG